jgi:hypothetical protein
MNLKKMATNELETLLAEIVTEIKNRIDAEEQAIACKREALSSIMAPLAAIP